MLRHYTLADDDLEIIRARRRPHNRFGFALQLCALRYPGRLLTPGEVIPLEVTRFLAAQLGLKADDLAGYASREETRHEHLAALRDLYDYKMFTGRGSRDLKVWTENEAETARSNEDLARRFVEQCRATQTILPGITVIERLCADALVAAERRIDARIADRLDDKTRSRLDALLTETADSSVTALLGFQFIPRIRDLPSKRLYLFDPAACPKELKGLIGGKVREPVISSNWPDILRSAATMVAGAMAPKPTLAEVCILKWSCFSEQVCGSAKMDHG